MSKEDDFKERFVALMQNFRAVAMKDNEAMWLIGNLAARYMDRAKSRTWADFKKSRSPRAFGTMLKDFEAQGNTFHNQGKQKHAYAIQVLAISMVASKQTDADIIAGNALLDDMIGMTVDAYRKNIRAHSM